LNLEKIRGRIAASMRAMRRIKVKSAGAKNKMEWLLANSRKPIIHVVSAWPPVVLRLFCKGYSEGV